MLMMVVFRFGWAKPVPVNMYRFKDPKRGMAVTALAGPVSNILISLVFLFLYGALYLPLQSSSFGMYLLEMLQIPPLDGSKVLFSVVSDETYMKLMRYERYGSIALLLLVSTGILGRPLSSAVHYLYAHMIPVAQWSLKGVYSLFYQ